MTEPRPLTSAGAIIVRPEGGAELVFTDLVTIGRHAACGICIPDKYASPLHAALRPQGGEWWLTGLGSTNGTWLSGPGLPEAQVREPVRVRRGEQVRIGRTILVVVPTMDRRAD